MPKREPIFNVPGTVLALLAIIVVIHIGRQFLSEADDTWFVLAMAFIPTRYAGLADQLPGGEIAAYTSPITHMLLHADATHLAFNGAWLLAFGSILNKRMGGGRFLAFSVLGGIAGVFLFYVLRPALADPVIGASGAISAMMGGVMRFLFVAFDRHQSYLLREAPALIASMSLTECLRDRRIILTTIVFIAINLLTIVGMGGLSMEPGTIAWEAHIGGYVFGLLAFGLFDSAAQNTQRNPPEVE